MDSGKILYSAGKNDECFTPRYVVEAILPYLDRSKTYWLPFDTEESEFVHVLRDNGFSFVRSHMEDGLDYFEYEPEHWDAILSNPPHGQESHLREGSVLRQALRPADVKYMA